MLMSTHIQMVKTVQVTAACTIPVRVFPKTKNCPRETNVLNFGEMVPTKLFQCNIRFVSCVSTETCSGKVPVSVLPLSSIFWRLDRAVMAIFTVFRRDFPLSKRPVTTFSAVQLMPTQVVSHGFPVDQLLRVLGFPHVVLRDMRAARSDAVAAGRTHKVVRKFPIKRS